MVLSDIDYMVALNCFYIFFPCSLMRRAAAGNWVSVST